MTRTPAKRHGGPAAQRAAAMRRAFTALARCDGSGEALLDAAAKAIVQGLDCRAAGFIRLFPDGVTAETLVLRNRKRRLMRQRFELRGRLRAALLDAAGGHRVEAAALAADPEAPSFIRGMQADAFRCESVLDAAGAPVGLMLAVLQGAERDRAEERDFFRMVARLAGAEYRRMLAESARSAAAVAKAEGLGLESAALPLLQTDFDRSLIGAIVKSANLAIIGRKLDGTIISWNAAAERVFGYAAEEAIGQPITLIAAPGYEDEWREVTVEALEAQSIVCNEFHRQRKDGTRITVRTCFSPIKDAAGRTVGISSITQDVTPVRRLERALERNMALLHKAQSMGSMGSWTWQAGSDEITLSSQARRVLGMAPEDGSIASLADYVGRFVHPDDRQRVGALLAGLSRDNAVVSDSHRIVLWDGRTREIQLWGEAVFDDAGDAVSMIGVLQDMTAVERVREALVASEARFRDFADVASDWIWETGSDGRFRYISDRISSVTGFPPSHYLGKTWADCIKQPDSVALSVHESEVAARRPFRDLFFQIDTMDGREAWVALSGKPRYESGIFFQGYRGAGYDATARKRSEGELRRAMEAAEKANEIKSRFLAAASHDLRQPLHAMRLLVNSLMSSESATERGVITAEIARGLRSMTDILNALLDVSELDAGRVKPDVKAFDLGQLFETLAVTAASRAAEKGLEFRCLPTSARVRTDPGLLARIVENFLSNAIQHTQEGRVLLGCRRRGANLRIEVLDEGPGIPADKQDAIFEEYLQLDGQGGGERGLGLGLAIVRRFSDLLQHPIDVQSRVGAGSRFAVEVPLADCPPAARERAAEPAEGPHDLHGLEVLLIENDEPVREATRRLLEEAGATVLAVRGSREAMRRMNRRKKPPDLIMTDLNLSGGVLGPKVVEAIRSRFGYMVPAIILTGETRSARLHAAARTGLPLLRKPASPETIWKAISGLLQLGKAAE